MPPFLLGSYLFFNVSLMTFFHMSCGLYCADLENTAIFRKARVTLQNWLYYKSHAHCRNSKKRIRTDSKLTHSSTPQQKSGSLTCFLCIYTQPHTHTQHTITHTYTHFSSPLPVQMKQYAFYALNLYLQLYFCRLHHISLHRWTTICVWKITDN